MTDALPNILPRFGLAPGQLPGRLAPEHPLSGSPERCIERFAVADAASGLWLLERLAPAQAPRREALGLLLALLCRDPQLAAVVPAYRPVTGGGFVLRMAAAADACRGIWQLSPYVPGARLPRPDYLDHPWRGVAVAEFLLALQAAGARLATLPPAPSADLAAYAEGLQAAISRHRPGLMPRLKRLRAALCELPALLAAQPLVLAHGDLHPLNVIWGENGLRAVIDWEFAGARPLLYDAANCVGCAGFEHPSGLTRGFALALVATLQKALGAGLVHLLPGMVLASRLGWLSEWLRKKDDELLGLELDYLDLLLDGQAGLARIWSEG